MHLELPYYCPEVLHLIYPRSYVVQGHYVSFSVYRSK